MATATSLITDIRYRLEDTDDAAYDNSTLLSYINSGQKEFAILSGCNQAVHTISSGTISTSGWALSGLTDDGATTVRYLNIYGIQVNNIQTDFAPRYEAVSWSPTAGTPTAWSIWGDKVYFDYTFSAGTLNVAVSFTYVPNDLTAVGNTVGVPEKWQSAIISYCCYRVHDMNREESLAQRAYAEYTQILQVASKLNASLLMGGGYSE